MASFGLMVVGVFSCFAAVVGLLNLNPTAGGIYAVAAALSFGFLLNGYLKK